MAVKYIAEITNTKEIILAGTADLEFWREYLKRERLFPFDADGRAEVFIGAIESKFNGILFRELVFSVAVSQQADAAKNDGYFLVQAFSSLRFFAFLERFLFKTPYVYADIELNFPTHVKLQSGGETLFEAKSSGDFSTETDEHWEGAIFLPTKSAFGAKVFYAKLGGLTKTLPFNPAADSLETNGKHPAFRLLKESNFHPAEWKARANATHARSKTFSRASL